MGLLTEAFSDVAFYLNKRVTKREPFRIRSICSVFALLCCRLFVILSSFLLFFVGFCIQEHTPQVPAQAYHPKTSSRGEQSVCFVLVLFCCLFLLFLVFFWGEGVVFLWFCSFSLCFFPLFVILTNSSCFPFSVRFIFWKLTVIGLRRLVSQCL